MIDSVISFEEIRADEIQGAVTLVGECGKTFDVIREPGVVFGYVIFRNIENDKLITVIRSREMRVVTRIESIDEISIDTHMDIELDLMIRGA